jgi:hypothetical protein
MHADILRKKYPDKKIIIINKSLYDISEFYKLHPGGTEILDNYLYMDATNAFDNSEHSATAIKLLEKYYIDRYHNNKYQTNNQRYFDPFIKTIYHILNLFYRSSEYYFIYFNDLIIKIYENIDQLANLSGDARKEIIKGRVIFDKIAETYEFEEDTQYIINLIFPKPLCKQYLSEDLNNIKIKIIHPDRITIKKYTPVRINENNIMICAHINKKEYNDVDKLIINSKCGDFLEFELGNYV